MLTLLYPGDVFLPVIRERSTYFLSKGREFPDSSLASSFLAVSLDAALVFCEVFMENNKQNGTRVAIISIIVENPDSVAEINEILHQASDMIIGRMGIPYRQKGISIISVVVDAEQEKISAVSGKLGRIDGVNAKTIYSKK